MNSHSASQSAANPYSQLVRFNQWADRGLHEVITPNFDRLGAQDAAYVLRVLDHIHAVDRIFQCHLQGLPHAFHAARSTEMPALEYLIEETKLVDDWYVSYVDGLSTDDFAQPVDFAFTNGKPGRMTRGEIILHVCQHGTYHRGNAGVLLLKNDIAPNQDRMTDFLETVA